MARANALIGCRARARRAVRGGHTVDVVGRDRAHRLADRARVERDEPATPQYDLAAIPDHIKAAAQRHRLSEELITAVIAVESNFDHAAVSQKGARGLMQLMPATASLIGVRDPHDPDENIDAGASHLRAMLDTFKGDLPLALAAYNAGEHARRPPSRHPTLPGDAPVRGARAAPDGRQERRARRCWPSRSRPRSGSRAARAPAPKAHMVSPSLSAPDPRATDHGPGPHPPGGGAGGRQLVLHDLEQRPSARTWSPMPAAMQTMDAPPSMPDPTVAHRPGPVAARRPAPRVLPLPLAFLRYDGGAPAPPRRRERSEHAIRHLLRAPATSPLGRTVASSACSRTRSRRSSWPTGSASTTPGRSSTTSSRSTRTPRRPRCSWPPRPSARGGSASGTASS